jgi:hypothetical protein
MSRQRRIAFFRPDRSSENQFRFHQVACQMPVDGKGPLAAVEQKSST